MISVIALSFKIRNASTTWRASYDHEVVVRCFKVPSAFIGVRCSFDLSYFPRFVLNSPLRWQVVRERRVRSRHRSSCWSSPVNSRFPTPGRPSWCGVRTTNRPITIRRWRHARIRCRDYRRRTSRRSCRTRAWRSRPSSSPRNYASKIWKITRLDECLHMRLLIKTPLFYIL